MHCLNNLFVDAMQKSFKEEKRSYIREYCRYAKKFSPDRLEAGRGSLSSINFGDHIYANFPVLLG